MAMAKHDGNSRGDFGRRVAETLDLDPLLIRPAGPRELGWRARRPAHVPLGSRHGQLLPRLDDALQRHRERRRGALIA